MELFSPGHLVVLLVVVAVLFFGWKQLPEMSRSVGRSLRIFRTELKGMGEDDAARASAAAPAPPQATVPPQVTVPPPSTTPAQATVPPAATVPPQPAVAPVQPPAVGVGEPADSRPTDTYAADGHAAARPVEGTASENRTAEQR